MCIFNQTFSVNLANQLSSQGQILGHYFSDLLNLISVLSLSVIGPQHFTVFSSALFLPQTF